MIEISRDSGLHWETLAASTPNDGVCLWQVGPPGGALCRVRVSSVDIPVLQNTSSADFALLRLSDAQLDDALEAGGGTLEFQWTDLSGESTHEVYRGALDLPWAYDHDAALACGLPADSTSWVTTDDQVTGQPPYYYLLVPCHGSDRRRGQDGSGFERPASSAACPRDESSRRVAGSPLHELQCPAQERMK